LAFSIVERPDGSGKVSLMGVDIVAVSLRRREEDFVMNFVMSSNVDLDCRWVDDRR
jgi:hypothetical protein